MTLLDIIKTASAAELKTAYDVFAGVEKLGIMPESEKFDIMAAIAKRLSELNLNMNDLTK